MKKQFRVKKKYEFENIIKSSNFVKNKFFIIYYNKNNLNYYRFGVSVGKKLGNAVFRNKYKRKIRSIIDNNKKYYQNNLDYIIIMRKACIDCEFSVLQENYIKLIEIINKGDIYEKK
ncbi:MAG: ribonuclease P protein component [bacterium]|nr:ribonuclease P protein component [bacterium]